jgi:hypothetical protein
VLIETFFRKQLGLKAHRVTKVEETDDRMVVTSSGWGYSVTVSRCGGPGRGFPPGPNPGRG